MKDYLFILHMCLKMNFLVGMVERIRHKFISVFSLLPIANTPHLKDAAGLCPPLLHPFVHECFGRVSCKQDVELSGPCLTAVVSVLETVWTQPGCLYCVCTCAQPSSCSSSEMLLISSL